MNEPGLCKGLTVIIITLGHWVRHKLVRGYQTNPSIFLRTVQNFREF